MSSRRGGPSRPARGSLTLQCPTPARPAAGHSKASGAGAGRVMEAAVCDLWTYGRCLRRRDHGGLGGGHAEAEAMPRMQADHPDRCETALILTTPGIQPTLAAMRNRLRICLALAPLLSAFLPSPALAT